MRDCVVRGAWLLCIAGCRYNFDPPVMADASPDNFAYSLLRLDKAIDAPLDVPQVDDFPLLVMLDAAHLDRRVMRPDGSDLRFYLEGQTPRTVLAHEIEDLGTATSALIAWVRVPRLDRNTVLRVSYGHGNGGDQDVPPASTDPVWGEAYVAVFHLAEAAAALRDSTANHQDAAIRARGVLAGTESPPGRIGAGRGFASSRANAVEIATQDLEYPVLTVSGWLYETTQRPPGARALVARPYLESGDNAFWLGDLDDFYHAQVKRGTGTTYVDADVTLHPVILGGWVHLALTVNADHAALYVNGAKANEELTGSLPPRDGPRPIVLGADINHADARSDDDLLDGILDEVRIERVARSAEWVKLEYLAMTDQLVTYGEVQRGAPP